MRRACVHQTTSCQSPTSGVTANLDGQASCTPGHISVSCRREQCVAHLQRLSKENSREGQAAGPATGQFC